MRSPSPSVYPLVRFLDQKYSTSSNIYRWTTSATWSRRVCVLSSRVSRIRQVGDSREAVTISSYGIRRMTIRKARNLWPSCILFSLSLSLLSLPTISGLQRRRKDRIGEPLYIKNESFSCLRLVLTRQRHFVIKPAWVNLAYNMV